MRFRHKRTNGRQSCWMTGRESRTNSLTGALAGTSCGLRGPGSGPPAACTSTPTLKGPTARSLLQDRSSAPLPILDLSADDLHYSGRPWIRLRWRSPEWAAPADEDPRENLPEDPWQSSTTSRREALSRVCWDNGGGWWARGLAGRGFRGCSGIDLTAGRSSRQDAP